MMLNVILNRKLSGAQLRRRRTKQKKNPLLVCLSPLSFLSGFYSPQEASVLNHSGEEEVNKKALENSCVWFIGTQDNRQKTREGRTDHHHPTKKKCVSAPAGSSRIVRPHWYAIACCREVGYFFFFFLTHCRNATLVVASPIWKIMKTHPLCLLSFFFCLSLSHPKHFGKSSAFQSRSLCE